MKSTLPGIVVLATALLCACGATPTAQTVDASSVESEYVATYEQMSGTVAQRSASERLIYVRYQGAIKACMTKAGYEYQPPPMRDPFAGMVHMATPLEAGSLVPISVEPQAISGLGIAKELADLYRYEQLGTPNPGFEKLASDDLRAKYSETARNCQPPEDTYTQVGQSVSTDATLGQFRQMLEQVGKDAEVQLAMKTYQQCMTSAGFNASSPEELRTLVMASFQDDSIPAKNPDQPGWTKAVETERKASLADATCREPAHRAGLAALKPLLDRFRVAHGDALAESQKMWEGIAVESASVETQFASLAP